jgi:hypothetical protein
VPDVNDALGAIGVGLVVALDSVVPPILINYAVVGAIVLAVAAFPVRRRRGLDPVTGGSAGR